MRMLKPDRVLLAFTLFALCAVACGGPATTAEPDEATPPSQAAEEGPSPTADDEGAQPDPSAQGEDPSGSACSAGHPGLRDSASRRFSVSSRAGVELGTVEVTTGGQVQLQPNANAAAGDVAELQERLDSINEEGEVQLSYSVETPDEHARCGALVEASDTPFPSAVQAYLSDRRYEVTE